MSRKVWAIPVWNWKAIGEGVREALRSGTGVLAFGENFHS